ncbi:MAG: hypothetical protein QXQ18_01825 [Candidatus Aenigmatarchaeota archaeon]
MKHVNCLYLNNGKESLKHFVVKAILFKILREKGKKVATEVDVDRDVVDLVDLDNLIAYEIERKPTREKIEKRLKELNFVKDIFFIDLKFLPNDIKTLEFLLKKMVV